MKKILTILAVAAIAMTSVLATSTNVQLKTSVDELPPSFVLSYETKELSGDDNTLIMSDKLEAENGQTGEFSISLTSNYSTEKSVSVIVTPEDFKLNGTGKSSNIRPQYQSIEDKTSNITAGVQNGILVSKFKLTWNGKSQVGKLDAGTYVSNVKIEYKVN